MVLGKGLDARCVCEMREDFRMFRIDRMAELLSANRTYALVPERSLHTFLRQLESQYGPQM